MHDGASIVTFTTVLDLGGEDSPDNVQFFDTQSSTQSLIATNLDIKKSYLFDSEVSVSSLNHTSLHIDFCDYISSHQDPPLFIDWFNLDDFSNNIYLD